MNVYKITYDTENGIKSTACKKQNQKDTEAVTETGLTDIIGGAFSVNTAVCPVQICCNFRKQGMVGFGCGLDFGMDGYFVNIRKSLFAGLRREQYDITAPILNRIVVISMGQP